MKKSNKELLRPKKEIKVIRRDDPMDLCCSKPIVTRYVKDTAMNACRSWLRESRKTSKLRDF